MSEYEQYEPATQKAPEETKPAEPEPEPEPETAPEPEPEPEPEQPTVKELTPVQAARLAVDAMQAELSRRKRLLELALLEEALSQQDPVADAEQHASLSYRVESLRAELEA